MRVFLYEFVTGGGWYSYGDEPCPGSLVREGRAMVEAIAADLAAINGVSVTVLHDLNAAPLSVEGVEVVPVGTRFEELAAFKRCAVEADWTIVIAPEMSGFLAQRVAIVEKVGGRVLGPPLPAIRLASDKHATAESLAAHGIKTPIGIPLERDALPPDEFPFPAVIKPRDGAGSLGVRLVQTADEIGHIEQPSRLEEFCPGMAVSIAFLCGPAGNHSLVPCRQQLSDDGKFSYLGGSLPLDPALADRAIALATRALAPLGTLCGYVGVDMVLGQAVDGSDDVVIEINARPTTSYVGLRAASRVNLAEALLQIAAGEHAHFVWSDGQVQFSSTGQVW